MTPAAVYLRISQDRTGRQGGITRQQEDCLALVAQIHAGVTSIIVWHVDRLYRQPRELEDLIDLVEQRPIRIEAVRGGGFDLNTTEGRLMARQLVAIAAYESGHKSDRVKRANKRLAEQGRWHGPARYGYGPGGVLIPEQAAVIRQMADRFLAGDSIRSITTWLNRSQIPPLCAGTDTSGLWHPFTVRSVLASARISGQRAYAPDARADPATGREILGPGDWEAIITSEETAQIRAILADPARRRTAPARPSLLGGIARCGKCGAGLTLAGHSSSPTAAASLRYTCQKDPARPERGGLSISTAHLDAHVIERVLHRLAHPRASSDPASPTALLHRIVELNTRIGQLGDDLRDRVITRGEHYAGRLAAAEALHHATRQLVASGGAIALRTAPTIDQRALEGWWQALDVTDRRAVITTLVTTLRVIPGPPGRGFDPARVRLTYCR